MASVQIDWAQVELERKRAAQREWQRRYRERHAERLREERRSRQSTARELEQTRERVRRLRQREQLATLAGERELSPARRRHLAKMRQQEGVFSTDEADLAALLLLAVLSDDLFTRARFVSKPRAKSS